MDGDVVDVSPAAKDGTFAGGGVVQKPVDAETQAGRGCPGAAQPTTPELSECRLTVVGHSPFCQLICCRSFYAVMMVGYTWLNRLLNVHMYLSRTANSYVMPIKQLRTLNSGSFYFISHCAQSDYLIETDIQL